MNGTLVIGIWANQRDRFDRHVPIAVDGILGEEVKNLKIRLFGTWVQEDVTTPTMRGLPEATGDISDSPSVNSV